VRGERIKIWRAPERVDEVDIEPGFGAVVRSDTLRSTLRSCLEAGATIAAACRSDTLLGYATIVPSSTHVLERWCNLPALHEIGALEVVRSERRRRLASALLMELTRAIPIDTAILFARGFVSHWDLAGTDLPPMRYRRMLVAMLGRVGLLTEDTDDPEVADDSLNFLAVRYGSSVESSSLRAFRKALRVNEPVS
jgi:hypothetical protein